MQEVWKEFSPDGEQSKDVVPKISQGAMHEGMVNKLEIMTDCLSENKRKLLWAE